MVVFFDKLDNTGAAKAASRGVAGEKKSWWKPW
jgi:hypothetical protein